MLRFSVEGELLPDFWSFRWALGQRVLADGPLTKNLGGAVSSLGDPLPYLRGLPRFLVKGSLIRTLLAKSLLTESPLSQNPGRIPLKALREDSSMVFS